MRPCISSDHPVRVWTADDDDDEAAPVCLPVCPLGCQVSAKIATGCFLSDSSPTYFAPADFGSLAKPKQTSRGWIHASWKCFFSENRECRGVLHCFLLDHVLHVTICFLKKKKREKKKDTSWTTFMATGRIFSSVLWHRPAWHLISAPKDTSEILKEPKNNCLKWQRTTSQSRGDLHCLSIKHSGLWRIPMRHQSWGNKCEQSAKSNEGNRESVFWEQSGS